MKRKILKENYERLFGKKKRLDKQKKKVDKQRKKVKELSSNKPLDLDEIWNGPKDIDLSEFAPDSNISKSISKCPVILLEKKDTEKSKDNIKQNIIITIDRDEKNENVESKIEEESTN